MKIDIMGGQATIGNLVVEITGRVQAVGNVEARIVNNTQRDGYTEIAVQTPTGVFAVQAYVALPRLENDEKYVFVVEVENDTYTKAKQPRLRYISCRPFVKQTAPAPKANP